MPQGSVLGPLLFLILIGDIDRNVANSFLSSFADDTRIGRHVESEVDAGLLQKDLDAVYKWTEINNMELNGEKFEHMHYRVAGQNRTVHQYQSSSGSTITEKSHVRDLGVTMSNTGNF